MKMVKSLLLGTAAGLVAMTGAQAADLPVKAKPVQYVKICSLYGAGFYYIPGTDMCLKVGGWVRQQVGWGVNGNLTAGALVNNLDTRATNNFAMRSRGYITADARNQTEYGTVRSYIAVGLSGGGTGNANDIGGAPVFSANRAFIQFAGFTFGVTQSFYDFYSGPATSFFGGNINMSSDTGDAGKAVTAYTAQLGNGMSASIGIEAPRNAGVFGVGSGVFSVVTAPTSVQRGINLPDVVGNVRIDQAWGGAQIMGAIHENSGQYSGAANTNANISDSNSYGWAFGVGLKLNAPMIGAGDYLQAQVNITQGATAYTNNSSGEFSKFNGTGGYGFGLLSDNVVDAAGGNHQTSAWGVNAAYEHFWSKAWQTSVYGAYQSIKYDATANASMCALEGVAFGAGFNVATCNNNFSIWAIGSRTQWNVDSQTSMGVDIVYQNLNTANSGQTGTFGSGTQATFVRAFGNQNAWMGQFRIHRNFYP
jgi:hypothetical protein